MIKTILPGVMDEQLTEELSKVAQRFRRKQEEITIQELTDDPTSSGRRS